MNDIAFTPYAEKEMNDIEPNLSKKFENIGFKLENCELEGFDTRYFSESKEQAHFLIDDIDFDLVQLESNLNLVFNLQNNRLNQVMKTLTIFSVIFTRRTLYFLSRRGAVVSTSLISRMLKNSRSQFNSCLSFVKYKKNCWRI